MSRQDPSLTTVTERKRDVDLISTLLSLSTVCLPLRTLTMSLSQLKIYMDKFRQRLTTEHLLHLKRLIVLLEALEKSAEEWKASHEKDQTKRFNGVGNNNEMQVMTSGELLRRLGRKVEGVNLLEIEKYLKNSKVMQRLYAFYITHKQLLMCTTLAYRLHVRYLDTA